MLIAATSALPVAAGASDWKFETGVTARETYTDNVAYSPTNARSDFITELIPYVTASKRGARLQADVRYSMQNVFYADQSSSNRTWHQLGANAKAELYEKEVYLDANASISQQITSLQGPISGTTASATGNLTNVSTLTVSPYWQHRFGAVANSLARYTHSEVSYGGNSFSNSSTDSVLLGLSSGSAFNDLFWGLNYSDSQTSYNSQGDVKFSSTSASLGYALTAKLRVNGVFGYQNNSYPYAVGNTALSGSFWTVGVSWAPTIRTHLAVNYGENLFGKTRGFSFDHRSVHTTWSGSYSEGLSTSSDQFAGVLATPIIFQGQPGLLIGQGQILTNSVFLNKRFQGAVTYAKGKSDFSLSAYRAVQILQQDRASFIGGIGLGAFQTDSQIKQWGFNAAWNWRVTNLITSNVGLGYGQIGFVDTGRNDNFTQLTAGLTRTFNPDLSGSVLVRHQERSSSQPGNDASENAIVGAVTYKF